MKQPIYEGSYSPIGIRAQGVIYNPSNPCLGYVDTKTGEISPALHDQYGRPVPDDLVLLPDIETLADEEIVLIDSADWYEVREVLMVSAKAINFLSEVDPVDAGIDLSTSEINFVEHPLHRFNAVDGWYHA